MGSCSYAQQRIGRKLELVEESDEIVTCEFPLEGLRDGFVVSLECQQSLLDSGQRRKVVGGKDLALDNGEM